ncbi:MAG: DUF1028 domain-containing protein [Anaerolineae bacterium]|nr:MAG: DUF1028 domain-containing protein [Anaerolineae bacterium]
MYQLSTFSIVACDLEEQAWGVAVASKFPAVGAVVPWAQAGVGAVATQSYANTSFGPRGLEMMAQGLSAEETLERLLAEDPERELRQVGLVDAQGRAATFTGKECHEWAGGRTGPGYAIQGNILVGANVVEAMEDAFLHTEGDLPSRLFAALLAGDRAGGDRRGKQSAAIYVVKPKGGYGGFNDRWIDYRVDNHIDPLPQLGELLELHHLYFGKSPESERVHLKGETDLLKKLQTIMDGLGYYSPVTGEYDETTRAALRAFLGNENFEERSDPDAGWIDRPVLEYILRKFAG